MHLRDGVGFSLPQNCAIIVALQRSELRDSDVILWALTNLGRTSLYDKMKRRRPQLQNGSSSSAHSRFEIEKLDDSLLLCVFDQLERVKDVGRAACVCTRWYGLLKMVSNETLGNLMLD